MDVGDRILASLPYFLPLFDGLRYGGFGEVVLGRVDLDWTFSFGCGQIDDDAQQIGELRGCWLRR